jgi:hypothetical protein
MRHSLCLLAFLLLAACGKGSESSGTGGTNSAKISVVNNRALLSWTACSGLPDGYYVEQSTDAVSFTQVQDVTETSTYLDGLTGGTTFYFRVRSHNSSGNSGHTDIAAVTP